MTLTLTRVDYASVGVTSRGTTRIIPSLEKKHIEKFVVGDHDGSLHIFGMKRGEMQLIFKSLPGPKISKVVLGSNDDLIYDKIFISYENSVKGFTKKGKLFLEFDTGLIESITAMYVLGADLAACARDLYHRYRNCKDADSYLSGETLHDVVLLSGESSNIYAVLACGDCAIRVLYGTKRPTVLRLPSIPTTLSVYKDGNILSNERVLVGTTDGKVGLLILQNDKTVRITWLVSNSGSAITSLDTYALQDDLDILVGRQDGIVDVFTFPTDDTVATLRFRYNAGESISTVAGGIIGTEGYTEVLVTTYSGRIFGLTTLPPGLVEAGINDVGLIKLKAEISALEDKLVEEKESSSFSASSLQPLILSVNYKMTLLKDDAAYSLSMELDTPIDNILIQSDTPVELLDVESNSAVVSLSACDPTIGNFVLATYRCQVDTNRLEMRLRTIEGQPGTLQIYVTSQVQPKCCRKITINICALSLHERQFEDINENENKGPFNELRLTGGFTIAEMHAWLGLVLPDVPQRPRINDSEATLNYVSSFIGTSLKCKYKKGSAVFLGENISSIIILRDMLTKEATKRKIKLDVFCNVADGSIEKVLDLIFPRLEIAAELTRKKRILDALEYWELKSDPSENLCTEYQQLLNDETKIRNQLSKDTEILTRLHGVITDLYVDWERAKGSRRITSKGALSKLESALESKNKTLLLEAFITKDQNSEALSNTAVKLTSEPATNAVTSTNVTIPITPSLLTSTN